MAGNRTGGKQAAQTNRDKYGEDFYERLGSKGGAASGSGGFAYLKRTGQSHIIAEIGRMGGTISRRGKKKGEPSKLSKHKVDAIKSQYKQRIAEMYRQSDAQVSSLSAKYGVRIPR